MSGTCATKAQPAKCSPEGRGVCFCSICVVGFLSLCACWFCNRHRLTRGIPLGALQQETCLLGQRQENSGPVKWSLSYKIQYSSHGCQWPVVAPYKNQRGKVQTARSFHLDIWLKDIGCFQIHLLLATFGLVLPGPLVSAAVPQGLGLPGEQSHDWIWMCSRPFCFLVCEIEVTTFIFLEQRFRIVGHFRISGLKTTSKNVLLYLVSLKKHPLKWIVLKHGSTRVPVPDGRNHSLQTELLFTHDSSTAAAAAHYNCMH